MTIILQGDNTGKPSKPYFWLTSVEARHGVPGWAPGPQLIMSYSVDRAKAREFSDEAEARCYLATVGANFGGKNDKLYAVTI